MFVKGKVLGNKTVICLILAAIILLSGVCFEKIKVQSFFECTVEFQRDAFVKEVGVKLVTSCSNETIGIRNSELSTQNGIRLLPGKRLLRIFILEFLAVEPIKSGFTFFSTAKVGTFEKKHPKAEVLYFIHRSDGKKRA